MTRIASFVAIGLVLSAIQLADGADQTPSSDDAKPAAQGDGEFRQVYDQWQENLTQLAAAQVKMRATAGTPQYVEAVRQANTLDEKALALYAKLQAAAEKAYAADADNREIGDLLLTIAVGQLRKDQYDDALRLAKFLIDHKYSNNDVYRIAASAAFALDQFDEAEKFLKSLDPRAIQGDPSVQRLLAGIQNERRKWDREKKFRADESKADDLPRVKLHTSQGNITVELLENEAPNTVANFVNLAEKGFYDGVLFHRVLPGFMAQVGDPLTKDPVKNAERIGSGGPGYTIADECDSPKHRDHFRGSLSMAHTSEPNSGGSQFFLCFAPTQQLDGKYTVFGRVIDGFDVLAKIQRIDPDKERTRPSGAIPDRIIKAEVLRKRDHAYEPKTIGGPKTQ
jgi:cyclophilin family peptidyl-prolyl cis-trans isomerase